VHQKKSWSSDPIYSRANHPKIDLHDSLPDEEMMFIYAPGGGVNAKKIHEMYTFYSVLNKNFRKTNAPRDGYPSNNFSYVKDLPASMRDRAHPFSIMDFN
jgi:hypothetical protein